MPTIQDVENAIRTWVKAGAGSAFTDARVFFNDQPVPRQATGPFVTVRFTDIGTAGLVDMSTNFDDARDPGAEVEVKASDDFELNASIKVWQAPTVTPTNAPDAPPSAMAIALRIIKAAGLPTIADALAEAGVSVFDFGSVQNLSRLKGQEWEGRAAFDVRFGFRDSISEFTTFIETAEVDNDLVDPPFSLSEEQ